MKTHTFRRSDLLLLAGLLLVGLVAALILCFRGTGARVQVRINGTVVRTLPLNVPAELELEGIGGTNTLVIENGTARVTHADCPDALCVRTGKVSRTGQTIVCLPHRLVVEVIGDGADLDALAG